MQIRVLFTVISVVVFVPMAAAAEVTASADSARLPEGQTGLAARYPGDVGIGKDPAVLMAEDFETPPPVVQ